MPEYEWSFAPGADLTASHLTWTWTDITDYARQSGPTVSRGRDDERSRVQPTSVALSLVNEDGRFTPLLGSSPYYPNVRIGTPLRLRVEGPTTALALMGDTSAAGASTPDTAALDLTADFDIRVEANFFDWSGPGWIIGNYDGTGTHSGWRFGITADRELKFQFGKGDSTSETATSTVPLPTGFHGRAAIRVTKEPSPGFDYDFYYSDSIGGTWVALGDEVATTVAVAAGNDATEIIPTPAAGEVLYGRVYKAQIRSPIDSTIVANPDFTAQTEADTSFDDSTGKTWTMPGDATLTKWRTRFLGYIAEWRPTWPAAGAGRSLCQVSAGGWLRRQQQGETTGDLPLRRYLELNVDAWWPLDDASGSTSAVGFGSVSGPMVTLTGSPSFGTSVDGLPGAASAVEMEADATLNGRLTDGASSIGFFTYMAAAPASSQTLLEVQAPPYHYFVAQTATETALTVLQDTVTVASDSELSTNFHAAPVYCTFTAVQNGGNIDATFTWTQVNDSTATGNVDISFTGTLSDFTEVTLWGPTDAPAAYAALHSPGATYANINDAAIAHFNETAGNRIIRLCDEEGIDLHFYGDPDSTEAMGVQGTEGVSALMFEAAEADQGLLYEQREGTGLAYRTITTLLNQTPRIEIDASSDTLANPFEPAMDERLLRNDVTASRSGGSSARVVDQDSIDATDRWNDSVIVNVASDDQLGDAAGWRVRVGSWGSTGDARETMRYPSVTLDLGAPQTPTEHIEAWLDFDLGEVLTIEGLPAQHPDQTVALMAQGYSEPIDKFMWRPSINCTPAGPYTISVLDDDTPSTSLGRLSSDGSTLGTGIDDNDTSLSIATASGPLWTTSASYYPMDVYFNGEQMTVTAVSGASSPQTFTVTRSVNGVVKSHDAGSVLSLAEPFVLAP